MGGHGGANILDQLQEGREQAGSWGENFGQAHMELSSSPCAELPCAEEDVFTVGEEWAARVAC